MAFLSENYYKMRMRKFNLDKTEHGYHLRLNFVPLGIKLDHAQDVLDAQVWEDVKKYMPLDTGALIGQTNAINVTERGRVFLYPPNSDYGHYQHEGVVYVDPVYGVGGFYNPTYGWWSRRGVTKVASDRKLTYSQTEATSHWGETAYKNHRKEWIQVVKRALQE